MRLCFGRLLVSALFGALDLGADSASGLRVDLGAADDRAFGFAFALPSSPKVRIERIFWPVVCSGALGLEPLRLRLRERFRPPESEPPLLD